MTIIDTKRWGVSEYKAGYAMLESECSQLEKKINGKIESSKIPQRPPTSPGDGNCIVNFIALATHVCQLRSLLSLSTDLTDVLSQAGSKTTAAQAAPSVGAAVMASKSETTDAPAWNPDAKILEARGVKSLDELNALPPATGME